MGTFERQIAKDAIMVQGIRAAALPLSAGLLGLGLAAAGFLAYNKVDDLKDWVADQWSDGFGLVNDAEQTQEQVSNYVSPTRNPPQFEGMSAASIYEIHYTMRDDLCQYFSRMWCEFNDLEWTGENHAEFLRWHWGNSWLGAWGSSDTPTFRFERSEVITVGGEDVNEISEYVYQMIIRETDSRNTQARLTSGLFGAMSTGIGAAFSEATHYALRSSGFMRGTDGWDGQNWEDAPGANRDPLLMYAWGRTDFQTGKWYSTIDSQGDVAFWLDVGEGGHGGSKRIMTSKSNPEMFNAWTYEQIIFYAHEEMTNAEFGPFLQFISTHGVNLPYVSSATDEELEAVEDRDDRDRERPDPGSEEELDNIMPGEEDNPENDPTKEEYWRARGEQPPPGWEPS